MNILALVDRYVLSQIVKPLGVAVAIGLLVLLSERLVRLLDVTLGKKNSFVVVFELLGYLVPHYLGLAIPAALYLGLLFGFNKLSKDSELDALMSTGIGLSRIARPVIALSTVLAIFAFVIVGWVQPHTRYAYRAVLFSVKNVEIFYLAEEGVFMQAGTRTFILDKLHRRSNRFGHIFLFDYRGANGAETITAKSGSLIAFKNDPRPVLRLDAGHRLKISRWPDLTRKGKVPRSTSASFAQTDTPLGKVSGTIFRPRGIDERELTFDELITRAKNPPRHATPFEMRTELHRRLITVAFILILPFLAIPFSIGTRRAQRASRFAVALIILVAMNEIIEQGAFVSSVHGASPYLTMWLPLALLAGFAAWRYWNTCFMLSRDRFEPVYNLLSDLSARLAGMVSSRFGARA